MAAETLTEQATDRRPLCTDLSSESDEPLAGTASRIDHWLLIEYRGLWTPRPLAGSLLSTELKAHLREQLELVPRSRLLFIRRSERRGIGALRCYVATTRERVRRLSAFDVESHDDLLGLDLAGAMQGRAELGSRCHDPLLVVCTHGKRDRCCAVYGRPLYEELREQAEPEWVWQSTHVGGDRFAGNVVCLPEGVYYGRVAREDVWALLDEHLAGRIYLERFRGRSCYPCPVQIAEREVRTETGLTGIDDLAFVASAADGGGWRVRFRDVASGELHEVEVTRELGDLTYLTCSAESLTRPVRYVATSHRLAPAL